MPNLSDLAEFWRKQLVGTEVRGEIIDAKSRATRVYHLRCSAVSWSGFGDRIGIVWDDLTTGGYMRVERTEKKLEKQTAETQAAEIEASVREQATRELEIARYDGLAGEVL